MKASAAISISKNTVVLEKDNEKKENGTQVQAQQECACSIIPVYLNIYFCCQHAGYRSVG